MRRLLLWSFAVKFIKTALNSDFIWIFYDFIHAGAGVDNSNFEHHRKLLSLLSYAVSFRRTDLNSDFTDFFHDFIHV